MDNRNFYVYATPVTGGAARELNFKCLNYGEAEGLAAPHLGDGEFISRIEQEFPLIEGARGLQREEYETEETNG